MFIRVWVLLVLSLVASVGFAQTEATKTEINAAVAEANKSLIRGPSTINVLDQANFALPVGTVFVPAAPAGRYLRALGNIVDEKSLVGLVFPAENHGVGSDWFAIVEFQKSGYVRDDDARDWKADDMLKSLQDATEQANAGRKARGLPETEVTGWAEAPAYDAATHRLVWSARVRRKGDVDNSNVAANYRTLALGREGYLSLMLVTNLSSLAADKPVAQQLLADIDYQSGKHYADFNGSTDHVAEYGLAALIIGVGAKKLGLIALMAAFAAKFFKVGLLAVLAFGATFKRFFKRQPKVAAAVAAKGDVTASDEPGMQAPPPGSTNAQD